MIRFFAKEFLKEVASVARPQVCREKIGKRIDTLWFGFIFTTINIAFIYSNYLFLTLLSLISSLLVKHADEDDGESWQTSLVFHGTDTLSKP